MSAVAPANSTVAFIRTTIRELCGAPGESQLTTAYIDQTLNNFYTTDFPYAIKLDQMRSVYTFYTQPNIDRYPLDVNYNQGVRTPMYVDGIQGNFFKDRSEFYAIWPRFPTKFQRGQSSLTAGISSITQAILAVVTSAAHGLSTGNTVYITGVEGMTELNGNSYSVTVINANTYSIAVDSTAFTAYVSGGTWYLTPILFSFMLPGPLLSKEVVIGGVDIEGVSFAIADNGEGDLQLQSPNAVVSVPLQTTNPAVPGMYNRNTRNPGLINVTNVGTVDYVTGQMAFTNPLPLQVGTQLTIFATQYQPGRPLSMLFWNNEFTLRPVPKLIHKVEIETYLTPVQFMLSTDNPILNQWAQYLAYGVSAEILRRRQDMAGLANVMEGFRRQEALVLERQATEEIGQRNSTLFSGSTPSVNGNNGFGQGFYG